MFDPEAFNHADYAYTKKKYSSHKTADRQRNCRIHFKCSENTSDRYGTFIYPQMLLCFCFFCHSRNYAYCCYQCKYSGRYCNSSAYSEQYKKNIFKYIHSVSPYSDYQ